MMHSGVDRKTLIIAFGGGVVGDLAGFASAIALRGPRLLCKYPHPCSRRLIVPLAARRASTRCMVKILSALSTSRSLSLSMSRCWICRKNAKCRPVTPKLLNTGLIRDEPFFHCGVRHMAASYWSAIVGAQIYATRAQVASIRPRL